MTTSKDRDRGKAFKRLLAHNLRRYQPCSLLPAEPAEARESSPMRRLLDETDYQLSPYIKLNGGLTFFDQNNSPVKSSSPSFTSSPSL